MPESDPQWTPRPTVEPSLVVLLGTLLAPRGTIDHESAEHHDPDRTPLRPDWTGSPGRWLDLAFRAFCRKEFGHCYHLDADSSPMEPEWWCCICPSRRSGFPPQRCRYCRTASTSR